MNYQTEDLHVLFEMTVKSINQISMELSHGFDQTLVKLGSNLKLKLIKILLSLKRGLGLTAFHMFGYFQPDFYSYRATSICVPNFPGKSLW
jgi:hypothetical protein